MRKLVIVPAFNEEGNLSSLLEELEVYQHKYDIVVIDDASRDNSALIARRFEGVTVIQLAANLGIGGAIQTGFKYAVAHQYDIAIQIDGDGQHDPAWLEKLTAPIVRCEANCVIGSRYMKDNPDLEYKTPFFRRLGMYFSSYILFLASGKLITDTTSGFRALDRQALNYFANDYPVDHPEAEALLMLMRQGFTIIEIPVKMRGRQAGQSLFTSLKAVKYPFRVLVGFLGLMIKKRL